MYTRRYIYPSVAGLMCNSSAVESLSRITSVHGQTAPDCVLGRHISTSWIRVFPIKASHRVKRLLRFPRQL